MTPQCKMIRLFLATVLVGLSVSACATATYYQPAAGNQDPGFRDQRIDDKKIRLSFIGNSVTPRETVEFYLIFRSAELTLENNFDYFIFTEHQVDAKTELTGASIYPGMYGYGYGFGYGRRGFPYYGGMGVQQSSFNTQTHYESVAYIKMQKGKVPDDLANAFDAREVIKNIGPRIQRPPARK